MEITPSFSFWAKGARYMVTSITDENNSMMSDGRSIRAMDAARSHSTGPNVPARALCLMIDTLRVRRTVVLATRKLVIIINRKFAASTSILGCSTQQTPARKFVGSASYMHCST